MVISNKNKISNGVNKLFQAIALGLEMGFLIAAPPVLFLFLGAYLDRKFDSSPIFLLASVVLSFVATILELRFLILPFMQKKVAE